MNYERWRIAAESFGVAAVAGSLIFVGVQIRQEHKIASAQLNQARNELMVTRFSALVESDAYLGAYAKLYATHDWPSGDLSDKEIAAAEIDAMLWWLYLETMFRNHAEGLVSDEEWATFEQTVRWSADLSPAYPAVFRKYWAQTPSDFTRAVEHITAGSIVTSVRVEAGHP